MLQVLRTLSSEEQHSFTEGWGSIRPEKLTSDSNLQNILFYHCDHKTCLRNYWNGRYVNRGEKAKKDRKTTDQHLVANSDPEEGADSMLMAPMHKINN